MKDGETTTLEEFKLFHEDIIIILVSYGEIFGAVFYLSR